MLVLARRQNEKIVFPNLDISVEVVRVAGNTVRIGVEAPKDVRVVREEILDRLSDKERGGDCESAQKRRHAIRNRLHGILLGLHVLNKQLAAAGDDGQARKTVEQILVELQELENLAAPPRTSEESSRAKLRALLVEDQANEKELLASYLRMSGVEVDTAEDGSKALHYLESGQRPDVVLLDMLMPQVDGPTTVKSIRRNPQFAGLKIFAISGSSPSQFGVPIGAQGVDRWFPKPLNPAELLEEMNHQAIAS